MLAIFLLLFWTLIGATVPMFLAIPIGLAGLGLWALLNIYPDKFLLHYLQARETIETDYPEAYRMARAEAHKFKITNPRIYTYSGFFHRAFAFASGTRVVFVIDKKALQLARKDELEALFFGLSLEVHERLAHRHTLALLMLSLIWVPALKLIGLRDYVPRTAGWLVQFFVAPIAAMIFRFLMPHHLWKKFLISLAAYPLEESRLRELNAKLDQPNLDRSVARIFKYRFYAANHSAAQQMILAIEGAVHPLDVMNIFTLDKSHV
jgi:hypothetical protein